MPKEYIDVWSGSTFSDGRVVYRWDGSTFQPIQKMYRWDGSTFDWVFYARKTLYVTSDQIDFEPVEWIATVYSEWDHQQPITVVINSDVTLWTTSPGGAGMRLLRTDIPPNCIIINNGAIVAGGGNSAFAPTTGGNGGPGIRLDATFTNKWTIINNGYICGGGGAGGSLSVSSRWNASGGGGAGGGYSNMQTTGVAIRSPRQTAYGIAGTGAAGDYASKVDPSVGSTYGYGGIGGLNPRWGAGGSDAICNETSSNWYVSKGGNGGCNGGAQGGMMAWTDANRGGGYVKGGAGGTAGASGGTGSYAPYGASDGYYMAGGGGGWGANGGNAIQTGGGGWPVGVPGNPGAGGVAINGLSNINLQNNGVIYGSQI